MIFIEIELEWNNRGKKEKIKEENKIKNKQKTYSFLPLIKRQQCFGQPCRSRDNMTLILDKL